MPKETYINYADFMNYVLENLAKSQVSDEKLVLLSDVIKAAALARRIEA